MCTYFRVKVSVIKSVDAVSVADAVSFYVCQNILEIQTARCITAMSGIKSMYGQPIYIQLG